MKKKGLKIVLIVVAVAIVAAVVAPILLGGKDTSYESAQAQFGSLTTNYAFTGTLASRRTQEISSPAASSVKDVYAAAGQHVEKNDKLIRLTSGETLRAPFAGEVTSVPCREDDQVSAGQTLLTIADLNEMEVTLKVDEYDVFGVKIGADARLTIPALGVETSGKVIKLNKLATVTQNATYYEATVSIEAEKNMLPGMEVGVSIQKEHVDNAVLLRMEALHFDEYNKPYVLIKNVSGQMVHQSVTVGISDGISVQILSGLNAGDKVYYEGTRTITMKDMMGAMGGGK